MEQVAEKTNGAKANAKKPSQKNTAPKKTAAETTAAVRDIRIPVAFTRGEMADHLPKNIREQADKVGTMFIGSREIGPKVSATDAELAELFDIGQSIYSDPENDKQLKMMGHQLRRNVAEVTGQEIPKTRNRRTKEEIESARKVPTNVNIPEVGAEAAEEQPAMAASVPSGSVGGIADAIQMAEAFEALATKAGDAAFAAAFSLIKEKLTS